MDSSSITCVCEMWGRYFNRNLRKNENQRKSNGLYFPSRTLGLFIILILLDFSVAQEMKILDIEKYLDSKDSNISPNHIKEEEPVSLLWGIADTSAIVGRLFKYHIPSDAFKGNIHKYVQLKGIATPSDIGQHYIEIKVSGPKNSEAKDVFSVSVNGETPGVLYFSKATDNQKPQVVRCKREQPETAVTIVLDTDVTLLSSPERVNLLDQLTNSLNLLPEMLKLLPVGNKPMFDSSALVSGPGDVKSPKFSGAMASWLVGCGKVEKDHMPVLQYVESAAKNGSITRSIGHSVIGWHVTSSHFQEKPHRRRRALRATATAVITQAPPTKPPVEVITPTKTFKTESTTEPLSRVVPSMESHIQPSHTVPHIEPTKTMVMPEPTARPPMSSAIVTPEPTPEPTTKRLTTPTTRIITKPTTPEPTPEPTTKKPTTTTTQKPTTRSTPQPPPEETPEPKPTVHPRCPNDDQERGPMKLREIDDMSFVAGKLTVQKINNQVFFDCKDGDTFALNLVLFANKTQSLPANHFLSLKKGKRYWKVEGMPLNRDIGTGKYRITAMNSIGVMPAFDDFRVNVLPDGDKTMPLPLPSHEISLVFDNDYETFTVSDRIHVTDKLAKLFGSSNSKEITVLRVDKGSVIFAWTNNSLPTDSCAVEDIHDITSRLITNDGSLSDEAVKRMEPYRLTSVAVQPMGACEKHPDFPGVDTKPEPEHTPEPTYEPVDTKKPTGIVVDIETTQGPDTKKDAQGTSDDEIWITTVVPAVVIVLILLIALLIACVLYRKKRKGKMSLEDKHTFVNRGVPVILPDEYDDKGNDSTKPLMLGEEKPPLPPPEYTHAPSESSRSSGDKGYEEHEMDETDINSPLFQRPPPPPAANGTKQPRPHLQPAYKSQDPNVPP
ncbi:hypothetical protein KUTeg_021111 [Tegillarca granosa]|uniref:Peptidase S72 domain-containing protein n=1 Tax=Tegillarca granosa TaxID=220873 RepID=A0ABQ9E9T9_TEGGR|nr:hypothetical protein KUTeg_021111 [Tegillarca granosa]